jgi:hypothetical protein
MVTRVSVGDGLSPVTRERVLYIKQMLGELAQVARAERQDMLVYLLEMAFTECGDVLARASRPGKIERNHAAGVPMQSASKV